MDQPTKGWRNDRGEASLVEVFHSVKVPEGAGWLRKALAFMGPGFLVSVGYMDPGNWATAIAGGAKYGYALLWVALLSNIMAIILQSLAGRLAIGSHRDLAQACRDAYAAIFCRKSPSSPLTLPKWWERQSASICSLAFRLKLA